MSQKFETFKHISQKSAVKFVEGSGSVSITEFIARFMELIDVDAEISEYLEEQARIADEELFDQLCCDVENPGEPIPHMLRMTRRERKRGRGLQANRLARRRFHRAKSVCNRVDKQRRKLRSTRATDPELLHELQVSFEDEAERLREEEAEYLWWRQETSSDAYWADEYRKMMFPHEDEEDSGPTRYLDNDDYEDFDPYPDPNWDPYSDF